MANFGIEDIKKLREATGAGMMDAKGALEEAQGDYDKALEVLRLKGLAKAAKKADRATENGVVESYVHGGQIGVLVEVACETDFVARTDDFQAFTHDLAMHIAAADPLYLDEDSVPEEVIEKEKALYKKEVAAGGKPAEHADKIVDGKLKKYYEAVCLMSQPFVKDPSLTIEQLRQALVAKLGENIVVRRFTRMQLGSE